MRQRVRAISVTLVTIFLMLAACQPDIASEARFNPVSDSAGSATEKIAFRVPFAAPEIGTRFHFTNDLAEIAAVDGYNITFVNSRGQRVQTYAFLYNGDSKYGYDKSNLDGLWPLEPGKTTSFNVSGGWSSNVRVRVVRLEEVNVPAGRFSAVLIEANERGAFDAFRLTTRMWYAPAAKYLVKIESDYTSPYGGDTSRRSSLVRIQQFQTVPNEPDVLCQVPLPKDLVLEPPSEGIPKSAARFAGLWVGRFHDIDRCTALAVTKIGPNGVVDVIYSYGPAPHLRQSAPGYNVHRGSIRSEDDALVVQLTPTRKVVYTFLGENLRAVFIAAESPPQENEALLGRRDSASIR